ncbi:hypothetical protein PR048_028571 [Dryococelus australis]|uniref:Uncharacterized protein n=1 Tax=Dryococelus australis TaxID=614101 RepID=A0ABQ9GER4_9NEOP|nr:hypothetical protein PR048_028571 [Dryococelus australis]
MPMSTVHWLSAVIVEGDGHCSPGGVKHCVDQELNILSINLNESVTRESGELRAVLKIDEPTRLKRPVETGDPPPPKKNPPTNCIVRHHSHARKSGSDLAGNRTCFALVGGEYSSRCTAATPLITRANGKGAVPGNPSSRETHFLAHYSSARESEDLPLLKTDVMSSPRDTYYCTRSVAYLVGSLTAQSTSPATAPDLAFPKLTSRAAGVSGPVDLHSTLAYIALRSQSLLCRATAFSAVASVCFSACTLLQTYRVRLIYVREADFQILGIGNYDSARHNRYRHRCNRRHRQLRIGIVGIGPSLFKTPPVYKREVAWGGVADADVTECLRVLQTASGNGTLADAATAAAAAAAATGNSSKPALTGIPQLDYVHDPNLPRELNGYNLKDYPFFDRVPDEMDFKCDGLHDGFYASVPHKCQVHAVPHAPDKLDVKHVHTGVDFAIGSQFIRRALDDSEPIASSESHTASSGNQARGLPNGNPVSYHCVTSLGWQQLVLMQNIMTSECGRIGCVVLRCNLLDLVKLTLPEVEEYPGSRTSARVHESPALLPGRFTPDFPLCGLYRTMPLVGGFSRRSPVSLALSFRHCSILTSITLIGSQDLDVKSRPNLFTHPILLAEMNGCATSRTSGFVQSDHVTPLECVWRGFDHPCANGSGNCGLRTTPVSSSGTKVGSPQKDGDRRGP